MAQRELSLFLAGDALVTRPWSHVRDRAFLGLIEQIRSANVAITNLETLIHEFKGPGEVRANRAGVYLASAPQTADELKWAGFDMLAHANNHTFDYGSAAVSETIENVYRANLILAGSGRNLQEARAPGFFDYDGGRVALVAMTSSLGAYGRVVRSRPDVRSDSGPNPLALISERAIGVPPTIAKCLKVIGRIFGSQSPRELGSSFRFAGMRFRPGNRLGYLTGGRIDEADLEANLDSISNAARNADIVIVSIHAHVQGPWLEKFADQAIHCGADLIFVHGPHHVCPIELRKGTPIFYGLGDFAFEIDHIRRSPLAAVESGADGAANANGGQAALPDNSVAAILLQDRAAFEGVAAVLSLTDGKVTRIRLLPLDLQFDAGAERRGRPQLAAPELGRRIIAEVAALSKPYGTKIRYDAGANCGIVECG